MTKDLFIEELLRIIGIDPNKVTDLHWVDYPYTIGYTMVPEHPVKFLKIEFTIG
jgi:hypothetical protein